MTERFEYVRESYDRSTYICDQRIDALRKGGYAQPDNYSDHSWEQKIQADNQVEEQERDGVDQREVEGERCESSINILMK